MATDTTLYYSLSSTQCNDTQVWGCSRYKAGNLIMEIQQISKSNHIDIRNICFHPLVRENKMGVVYVGSTKYQFVRGTTWREWFLSKNCPYTDVTIDSDGIITKSGYGFYDLLTEEALNANDKVIEYTTIKIISLSAPV